MTKNNLGDLDFDCDIKPLISNALLEAGFFPLSDDEVSVLRGAWLGWSYKEMAEVSGCSVVKLERIVAKSLFERLSSLCGENIQKNTLRKAIAKLSAAAIKHSSHEPETLIEKQRKVGSNPLCERFIPRNTASKDLTNLIETNRVVFLIGHSGIGKTSLISNLFSKSDSFPTFQGLVWKYSISSDIQEDFLDLQRIIQLPNNTTMFDFLHNRRILICIDGIDDWFKNTKNEKEAQSFLRKLIEVEHNSCIVFTMREPIALFELLQCSGRLVQTYELKGLSTEEAVSFLSKYNLKGEKLNELVSTSRGNPQHLYESAQCIERLYGGNIDSFLDGKTSLVLNAIKRNFSTIGSRLQEISDGERGILSYIESQTQGKPVLENDIIEQLRKQFGYSMSSVIKILNALKSINLVVAEDSSGSTITVPHFVSKYIQLNPEQFPSLALPV